MTTRWICNKDEPRGADVHLAGCCIKCGTVTVHRNSEALPHHEQHEVPYEPGNRRRK